MSGSSARRALVAATIALASVMGLSGCVAMPPRTVAPEHVEEVVEQWDQVDASVDGDASVILSFDLPADVDDATWDAMLDLELVAGDALLAADAGYLDGNGTDGVVYDVFFYGLDHEDMWAILEPVYADAPIAWSTTQLWERWDDAAPAVELTQ